MTSADNDQTTRSGSSRLPDIPLSENPLPKDVDLAGLRSAIHDLVKTDLSLSTDLLTYLQQERLALQERKFSELAELLNNKAEVLDKIDGNAQQRRQLLQQSGVEIEDRQWNRLIAELEDEALQQDWQQLLQVLENARNANSINGKMVSRSQQTLGRLLNLLRGQISVPELYDQRGSPTNGDQSRTCIKI